MELREHPAPVILQSAPRCRQTQYWRSREPSQAFLRVCLLHLSVLTRSMSEPFISATLRAGAVPALPMQVLTLPMTYSTMPWFCIVQVSATLRADAVPALRGAEAVLAAGVASSLAPQNAQAARAVRAAAAVRSHPSWPLLLDPQTGAHASLLAACAL